MIRVEEDIIETLPDGRQRLIVPKGAVLTEAQAERLGLRKQQPPQPSETKEKDEKKRK